MEKRYKDYPFCHALAAGHATENSIPFGAFEAIAYENIETDNQPIWEAAEDALMVVVIRRRYKNFTDAMEGLKALGYQQAMGTEEMAEAQDNKERERLTLAYDTTLGLEHPAITALVDLLY